MHKKPLVAAIILGLLMLTPSVGLAKAVPNMLSDKDIGILPRVARNLQKPAPGAPTALSGPATTVQLGVSRTGATFCDGDGYGGPLGQYGSWFYGDEFYANFQDPENFGSCNGNPSTYTFDVTAMDWWMVMNDATLPSFDVQPLVYENAGDAICPLPGAILCAGPLYTVTLPATGGYILSLPTGAECCVFDPYFAGIYVPTVTGTGVIGLVVDDDGATGCWNYNDYGGGWVDLVNDVGFVGDLMLWSEGTAFDQNSCPGAPGVCDWQSWTDGNVINLWTDPDGNGLTDYYVRFNAAVSCTLETARVFIYGAGVVGTPTLRVRVYGSAGPVFGGLLYPDVAIEGPNFLGSVDVPFANLNMFPTWTDVDLTSLGPLNFGPGEDYFITVSLSPLTPDPMNDQIAFLSDTPNGGGTGADPHSGAFVGLFADYFYFGEVFSSGQRELYLEAYTCCEVVPLVEQSCAAPGPDDWNTWAHDYNRTSATSISVGDPCQVTAAWYTPLPELNSFNEPTIAGDVVYISSDNTLTALDLATGAPVGSISGLPHIFSANRGNTTVEGGKAYVTGGTAQSIGRWDAALSVNDWVNGIGAPPGLGDNNRFGVTAVYNIAGTDVVVVGTEGAGQLWAFDAATGAAYPGWATNPVVLGQPMYHSPAFDGTDLYVGTGAFGNGGAIYRIDAATGTIVWTYSDPTYPNDGYPGGVSTEGTYVYAASDDDNAMGRRTKLNKADGSVVWQFNEARSLYGAPTIGRTFLYIPQDVGGTGVIMADKNTGAALYNFALNGVTDVTQGVTLMCDNYLFAGDRAGNWWLLDINNQAAAWHFAFNGLVNGTAIASHSVNGKDYAVVGLRSDASGVGAVAAFEFNAGPRPRLQQNVASIDINVPFGTGAGNLYSEPNALENIGCADLNFTAINILDPLPNPTAKAYRRTQDRYAAALANATVGPDYTSYFEKPATKRDLMATRMAYAANDEMTIGDVALDKAAAAMHESKRSSNRRMASSAAALLRTSGVTVTQPLPAGTATNLDFTWDGSALERGVDVEQIEFVTDDPDRVLLNRPATVEITYIGGCLPDETSITWNTGGASNTELVFNTGKLGDSNENGLSWGGEDGNIFEGGFFLAGDSSAAAGGAQWHIGDLYGSYPRLWLPNPRPSDVTCNFDGAQNVPMGFKREGGCPGTPTAIDGEWVRSYYVDTNEAQVGTPLEAIGVIVTQTEVGAYDPLYGDFKLLRFEFQNRDAVAKGPLYAGSWFDWDVQPDYAANHGFASTNINGYVLWDQVSPNNAFGVIDPDMQTSYAGVDPTTNQAHRAEEMGERDVGGGGGNYDTWQSDGPTDYGLLWWNVVDKLPAFGGGAHSASDSLEDHAALLVNKAITLDPNGSAAVHQALFAVDASSNDNATIEAEVVELAKRAAKWGGFARGDVNDDGVVNLVDVCWIMSGNQIYPDAYNGDVNLSGGAPDANDRDYLLQYVSGLGPAPMGAWRFTF